MENRKTDPSELTPPTLKDGVLVLAHECHDALRDMLNPGCHPSMVWVHALQPDEQLACLRYASAVIVHDLGRKIPPAPQCLKDWANDSVPRVELVYPEGLNNLGEQVEGVLETIHQRLDQWFRRVALSCGSLEDGDGPYPKFSVELHFNGYSVENEPLLGAVTKETITEAV